MPVFTAIFQPYRAGFIQRAVSTVAISPELNWANWEELRES